jgi:hypothetical protein
MAIEKAMDDSPAAPILDLKAALKTKTLPLLNARLLTRDFIHNSLYNPHYGYFSNQAMIFSPPTPFQFNQFKNNDAFTSELSKMYTELEAQKKDIQIWHTPTELFQVPILLRSHFTDRQLRITFYSSMKQAKWMK